MFASVRRVSLLMAAVAVSLAAPVAAHAAAPPSTPATIKTVGFENATTDSMTLRGINLVSEPWTDRYWGRVSVSKRTGTYGLWCAGKVYPSGADITPILASQWPSNTFYRAYTRGEAELDLSTLSNYYSANLSFYYNQKSLGAADANAFSIHWDDTAADTRSSDYGLPLTADTAFVQRAYDLSSPSNTAVLSRRAGVLTFQFFDSVTESGAQVKTGRGALVDDVSITGFKYGPVRELVSTPGEARVSLAWQRPARSRTETADEERSITYRVWRTPAGQANWTELTTTRLAEESYTDMTAIPNQDYTYAVQAWDTGTGTGYGTYVTVDGAAVADVTVPTVISDAESTYDDAASINITGADTGSGVASISYRFDAGTFTTVPGSAFTAVLNQHGAHSLSFYATDVAGNSSVPQTVFFTVVDTVDPTVSCNPSASYNNSASIPISATDAGSGVASISYRFNGEVTQTVAGASATAVTARPGSRSITVVATDVQGNVSAPLVRNFTLLDTVKPVATCSPASTYNNSATVTVNATDAGSGVTSIEYRFDNSTTQTVPFASLASASTDALTSSIGARTLTIVARDGSGNVSTTLTRNFTVLDTIKPSVSFTPAASYNDTATIAISATDSGSGVAYIDYRFSNGTTVTVAGAGTTAVTGYGVTSLTVVARDVSGNVSAPVTKAVTVHDTIKPTAAHRLTYHASTVDVEIDAADWGSGVASITYRIDSGAPQTVNAASADFAVSGFGNHTVDYEVRDEVGNILSVGPIALAIGETTPPEVVIASSVTTFVKSASVAITATDAGSGVARIDYKLGSAATQTVEVDPAALAVATVNTSVLGQHSLRAVAFDLAGNVSAADTFTFAVVAPDVARVSGAGRYGTAKSIAETGFDPAGDKSWPGVTEVIVASGEDRSAVDALPASGLSFNLKAPLLLINSTGDPAKVEDEIAEIARARGSVKITFVGGTAAIPQATMNALVARVGVLAPGRTVTGVRVAGSNRYDTAVAVSKAIQTRTGRTAPDTVLIANGADQAKFSDALALSPIAAAQGYPILLVSATAVPAETSAEIARLTTAKGSAVGIVAAGGPNTIASSVLTSGLGVADDAEHRWAGTNRYLTATTIATKAQAKGWLDFGAVGFAASLPDALAGGGMLGSKNGVLLLTQSTVLSPDTAAWLSINGGSIEECYIFGGTVVITPAVEAQINNYLQ